MPTSKQYLDEILYQIEKTSQTAALRGDTEIANAFAGLNILRSAYVSAFERERSIAANQKGYTCGYCHKRQTDYKHVKQCLANQEIAEQEAVAATKTGLQQLLGLEE